VPPDARIVIFGKGTYREGEIVLVKRSQSTCYYFCLCMLIFD
jgi:hypothetical protein